MDASNTNLIQVTNIAPATTMDQMRTLFSFLGQVTQIVMYPEDDSPIQTTSKICFIRYADSWSVDVALHLTNTVFIDRALIVLPVSDGEIPDSSTALSMSATGGIIGNSGNGVVSQVVTGIGGAQVITTIDPKLSALGLPQYPPLPANMDPTKIEEIRRTIYVGNLESSITAEQLLKFFNQIAEVKYVRMAGDDSQPTRFAFVEFTEQSSVPQALQYHGVLFNGRPLKINHSNNAIVKPIAKTAPPEGVAGGQKEIEEAMKRVREAQSLISAAIEPSGQIKLDKILELAERERKRSRSRSRSRSRRSRSRDRRTRRSRSRSRDRRVSPMRSSRRRSRSPKRRSSRERSRERRSRSRDRDRHHKSSRGRHERGGGGGTSERDRDRESRSTRESRRDRPPTPPPPPPRRERDRGAEKSERDRDRDRVRDRDRERRRSRSRSPTRMTSKRSDKADKSPLRNPNPHTPEGLPRDDPTPEIKREPVDSGTRGGGDAADKKPTPETPPNDD